MPHTEQYTGFLSLKLATMHDRALQAIGELQHTYQETVHEDSRVTPLSLGQRLEQFFIILKSLDEQADGQGLSLSDDMLDLADQGLELLDELYSWADRLDCDAARGVFEALSLTLALWCAQHEMRISHLDPVVNALSRLANGTHNPRQLGEIGDAVSVIIDAVAPQIKQDTDKSNPGRPWRILNLNLGIVATRSHDPKRMESVFAQLLFRIPDDAPGFFAEGMQQMDAIGYPAHVRKVMQKYYDITNHPTLH